MSADGKDDCDGTSRHPGNDGMTTDDRMLAFVLTMHERRAGVGNDDDKDTFVGNAVLVAPNLAITAVHCLADAKDNLWVKSALGEGFVRVVCLRWERESGDRCYAFGDATSVFPSIRSENWAEDIVGLFLDEPMTTSIGNSSIEVPCAEIEEAGNDEKGLVVGIAASDGESVKRIRYTTFKPHRDVNKLVVAKACPPALGYPLESGAPALAMKGTVLSKKLRGLQVSAPGPLPERLPAPYEMPAVGVLPITAERSRTIKRWSAIKVKGCGGKPVPRPAPSKIRSYVIYGLNSRRLISGNRPLVTLDDLDFFHGKDWYLHAVSSRSGILTSGGLIWTRRIAKTNQIVAQILARQSRELVEVVLSPSSVLGHGGFLWLQGVAYVQGKSYYIYLFRAEDECRNGAYKGRLRIAIFDAEGPHLADRPEYNEINFDVPGIPSDDDRVQDDVGNGHEGHDPP